MSDQSAAEQRAFAVAKLKRAASLPRMQNGRRPKMHVEAVSEGERSHGAASVEPDSSEAPTPEPRRSPGPEDITIHQPVAAFATALIEPPTPTQADIPQEPPEASQSDVVPDPEPEVEIETEAEPAPAKKRRRSRSRSRGSRDLRKLKGAQSPPLPTGGTTTPAPADDSSPEDIPHTLPPFMPFTPQVLAPIPSHFAQFQAQRLLMTPEPGMFFGAAAASPTSPSTPMPGFPSLEDIQRGAMARGLQRSNSAAARLMALNKLQGGVPELPSRSNTPAPLGTLGLGRNNTVSGAEPRAAARQILLRRLGERIDKADGNTSGEERATTPKLPTSSGEEDIARPTTPRRRKRRSRRASNAGPGEVVDDRELAGEAALAPPTPSLSELGTTFTPTASDVGNSQLQRSNTLAKLLGQSRSEAASTPRVTTPRNRRSIVVELDEDDTPIEPEPSSLMSNDGLPVPMPAFAAAERVPYSSNDSFGVPMFYEEKTMYTDDAFPSSPFATPLRERPPMDDEQVLFSSAVPRPWQTTAERDVSWVDDPLFRAHRMPVNDDDEEEEDIEEEGEEDPPSQAELEHDEPPLSAAPSDDYPFKEESLPRTSASVASDSGRPFSDREESEEPPSIHSDRSRHQDEPQYGLESETWDARVSTTSAAEGSHEADPVPPTPSTGLPWEDARPIAPAMEHSISRSRWEKVKQSFSRSNSRAGLRSRNNSVGARDNTLSIVSRESGISQGSGLAEKDGAFAMQQATPPTQSPSASTTLLNLSSGAVGSRSNAVSPIPQVSTADLLRYGNSKLFPFPGIVRLEEERNRSKNATPAPAESVSASASEIALTSSTGTDASSGGPPSTWSNATARLERKLSKQPSETGLRGLFSPSPAPISAANSQNSQPDYFEGRAQAPGLSHSTSSQNLKQTGEKGVRRWFSSKKLFSPISTTPSTPNLLGSTSSASPAEVPQRAPPRIPSLSDLLKSPKQEDLSTGWEDLLGEASSETTGTAHAKSSAAAAESIIDYASSRDTSQSPAQESVLIPSLGAPRQTFLKEVGSFSSPPERLYSSATPDPTSSLDEYPTRASSPSSSTLSSRSSAAMTELDVPVKGPEVLQRLDEMLGRGNRNPMWSSAVDDPPRKLVLSSPVLQVVNSNTVKDRFLFMFNDVLVIAKPILQDHDLLMETKPSPLDRKFIVKNVVHLTDLRISADRDQSSSSTSASTQSPAIREFVQLFASNPDKAISDLFAKARFRDDPVALGYLLSRTIDLDRAALGEYLTRRSSRVVLKAYVDGFGLTGLRVDRALRAFLMSIGVPSRTPQTNPLEHLVDAFAGRWYDANAESVPYDKDLAVRLARALIQLNEVIHGAVSDRPGFTAQPQRNIASRDFIAAFRKYDMRGVVSDELLDQVYTSIRNDRLVHGRISMSGRAEDRIAFKRPLPARLTYRVQSDPIIVRLSTPDPHLRLELYGAGLTFDPPVLDFSRSPEASFRITGNSLGAKTITFVRTGPDALLFGGLPVTSELVVERAFMRNTFQLAFEDHENEKRKYMFSVDDPLLRHQWIVSLKRQMEIASTRRAKDTSVASSLTFHKAADSIAIKVLQQTLIDTTNIPEQRLPNMTSIDVALQRVANEAARAERDQNQWNLDSDPKRARLSLHARSKSRSKVYHRHGPGKLEPRSDTGLPLNVNGHTPSNDTPGDGAASEERPSRVWSGRDLENICQRNSSIALVLAYLQVGSPDHESSRWSTALR